MLNVYFIGVCVALVVFFSIGMYAGRKVQDTNDYYVAGHRAPTVLITGSLIASFLSTGAFLGDTGEVYSGFFMGIVIVGVLQSTGYIYGAVLFGKYIRRSEVNTIPEFFGKRFASPALRRLSALIMIVAVCAYMLSAIQGVASIMSSISGMSYSLSVVIVTLTFATFTVISGSPGVLLTDTVMFLTFLFAAMLALPYVVKAAGGWFGTIEAMANSDEIPGILSWTNNLDYMYTSGWKNLAWAVTYGIVWALVVSISPWQTSRYLMAKNEHIVLRSSIWASMGVMCVTIALYFCAVFIRRINSDLEGSSAIIWAAMNVLPIAVGIVLLTGIMAAGLSSASTFLSLIGFSLASDFVTFVNRGERWNLAVSRVTMLVASAVILIIAYFNPPEIFLIMYFGGTVIASSWAIPSFGSIWSKKLNHSGAFWSMLCGFIGCVVPKAIFALLGVHPPLYLDPFFIGVIMSAVGAVIGSRLGWQSEDELKEREKLFLVPEFQMRPGDKVRTHKLWIVYAAFGLLVGAFFVIMYAMPYMRAVS